VRDSKNPEGSVRRFTPSKLTGIDPWGLQDVAGSVEAAGMAAHVSRWRRYGKDRLYVTATDGTALGYRDLVTGRDHVDLPERSGEFHTAVTDWSTAPPPPAPGGSPLPSPAITRPRSSPGHRLEQDEEATDRRAHGNSWQDLASNEAGAMAARQALLLRRAAPVRTLLARIVGRHTDERAWRIGADGERTVARTLEKLARRDPRWRFLHALPVGERGSDIDHLAIGPGGVLTFNTKHHPGATIWVAGNTFLVNGRHHPYLRNSRHEATRAATLLTHASGLPLQATAVIVPVGAHHLTIKTPPADVAVVDVTQLTGYLARLPPVLTEQKTESIFAVARRSTTWQAHR